MPASTRLKTLNCWEREVEGDASDIFCRQTLHITVHSVQAWGQHLEAIRAAIWCVGKDDTLSRDL